MFDLQYQILDAINASIYWKDLDGKYLGCNKYMANMAGQKRENIIGKTDFLLPWKKYADKIKKIDDLVIANKKKYDTEEQAINSENIVQYFLSSKSPMLDDTGNVIGIIGVSIDITHNKKLTKEFFKTEVKLNEYNNLIERFLRNISHESRVPLSATLSIMDLLKDNWHSYDENQRYDQIVELHSELHNMASFLLNTFDLSNFTKSEVKCNFLNHNFTSMVKEVIDDYSKKYKKDGIEITFDKQEDKHLVCDKKLILQVIDNLFMNALSYSVQNKIIEVKIADVKMKNTDIPAIQFSISDRGVGIPQGEFKSIFNPFTESSKTASNACGRGLGLSISKEIINMHHGHIWVENNNNDTGSIFHFCIPKILLSNNNIFVNNKEIEMPQKIITKDLSTTYIEDKKLEYALIGISSFNSYFSEEKITKIISWCSKHFNQIGIFIPDQISRYTFEALGYSTSRINQKIRKQDNYVKNKVNKAIDNFLKLDEAKNYPEIKIYKISELMEDKKYQNFFNIFSKEFDMNQNFRKRCLELVMTILEKNSKIDSKAGFDNFNQRIAAQYLLCELPVMIYANEILGINKYHFVYNTLPEFLKTIYLNTENKNCNFLVLK